MLAIEGEPELAVLGLDVVLTQGQRDVFQFVDDGLEGHGVS